MTESFKIGDKCPKYMSSICHARTKCVCSSCELPDMFNTICRHCPKDMLERPEFKNVLTQVVADML